MELNISPRSLTMRRKGKKKTSSSNEVAFLRERRGHSPSNSSPKKRGHSGRRSEGSQNKSINKQKPVVITILSSDDERESDGSSSVCSVKSDLRVGGRINNKNSQLRKQNVMELEESSDSELIEAGAINPTKSFVTSEVSDDQTKITSMKYHVNGDESSDGDGDRNDFDVVPKNNLNSPQKNKKTSKSTNASSEEQDETFSDAQDHDEEDEKVEDEEDDGEEDQEGVADNQDGEEEQHHDNEDEDAEEQLKYTSKYPMKYKSELESVLNAQIKRVADALAFFERKKENSDQYFKMCQANLSKLQPKLSTNEDLNVVKFVCRNDYDLKCKLAKIKLDDRTYACPVNKKNEKLKNTKFCYLCLDKETMHPQCFDRNSKAFNFHVNITHLYYRTIFICPICFGTYAEVKSLKEHLSSRYGVCMAKIKDKDLADRAYLTSMTNMEWSILASGDKKEAAKLIEGAEFKFLKYQHIPVGMTHHKFFVKNQHFKLNLYKFTEDEFWPEASVNSLNQTHYLKMKTILTHVQNQEKTFHGREMKDAKIKKRKHMDDEQTDLVPAKQRKPAVVLPNTLQKTQSKKDGHRK